MTFLTDKEHKVIDLMAEVDDLLSEIIGPGASRDGDLAEMTYYIHGIQNAVLAQAAARLYPSHYRLMGEVIE